MDLLALMTMMTIVMLVTMVLVTMLMMMMMVLMTMLMMMVLMRMITMIARRLLVPYRTLLALCSVEKRKDQIAEALDPLNSSASTPPGTICIKIL